jgi:uncharacterized protein
MRPQRHLVIFARTPRLGRVKSRLAAGIGGLAALRFYRQAIDVLLRRLARDRRWRCHLAVTPDRDVGRWPRLPVGLSRHRQGDGDLGRRMARVFRSLPAGPAIIIGSDITAITPAHIAAAFRALGRHDAVLGPAADGGYWLIGLRRSPRVPHPLLRGVRWSSEHALCDTVAGLPRGMSVAFADALEDIDDAAGYARWLSAAPRPLHARSGAAAARPGYTGDADCRAGA